MIEVDLDHLHRLEVHLDARVGVTHVILNKVILTRNRDLHKQLEHETETQENLSLQIQHFEKKTNVLLNLLDLTFEKQSVVYKSKIAEHW
jgi:hypothetical protein